MDFVWPDIETSRGVFEWSEWDQFVEWGQRYGIEIIPLFLVVPYWLYPSASNVVIPPSGAEFDDFVSEFGKLVYNTVDRYKGKIRYFEIWNEPNLQGFWDDPESPLYVYDPWHSYNTGKAVQKYVSLLQEGYRQAKRANPDSIVISAGISNYAHYLEEMYSYGAKGYFDVFGSHPYFWHGPTLNYDPDYYNDEPDRFPGIQRMRDVMVANGDEDKKIMITELGVDGESGPEGATTEAIQARALTRVFEKIDYDPGYPFVVGVMWFHLRTDMGSYGLLREDYTPTQKYYAYRDIIQSSVG